MYGVTDSFWVGRLGPAQLEAMGASSFAYWVLLLIGEVAAVGVQAVAASCEGAGQRDGVGRAVVQGLWASLVSGVLGLLLAPLAGAYLALVGVGGRPEVMEPGLAYLHNLAWGTLPMTAGAVLASGFKGVGEMRPVLLVNIVCVVFNFVIDPLLIWGKLGFPRLGAAGAAVATNLCATVSAVFSWVLIRREGVPLPRVPPLLPELARIVKLGLPVALSGFLGTGTYIALGRLLSGMGSANLAALGLGHRIEALAFTICEGLGTAASTVVGQWLGAGRAPEARQAAARAARASALLMAPLGVAMYVLAVPLVSIFTSDPTTLAAAVSYIHTITLCFPFMGVEFVMDGALVGAGDTMPSFIIGLVLNTARLPMALWLSASFGVRGVWIAITVSTVMKSCVKILAFKLSRLPLLNSCKV